jgi:hypothetical protein
MMLITLPYRPGKCFLVGYFLRRENMAKFFITLNRQITIQAQFDIDAENEEDAHRQALELAAWDNPRDNRDNGIEWDSDRTQWVDSTDPVVARVVVLD